jgi:hypothetical protein
LAGNPIGASLPEGFVLESRFGSSPSAGASTNLPPGFVLDQPKAAAPDTPTPEPTERPGFFKRLGQAFGLPTSEAEATGAQDQASLSKHPENLIPLVSGAKVAYGIGKSVYDKAKSAVSESLEAEKNVDAGGSRFQNMAKAAFAGLPDIAQGYGEDIQNKNYSGAAGTATGAFLQAALTKLPSGLKNTKNALVVGDDLKQAAAMTPDVNTAATAQRTASEIHSAAIPELTQKAGAELDKVASQLGVDTTQATSLSHKAELAGRGAKVAGQKLYAQLDQAAADATGQPSRFQQLAKDVTQREREAFDPQATAAQRAEAAEKLEDAKVTFETYKQEMVRRGLSADTIKQADKFWAQGSALDELSRHLLNAEDAAGNLKPTARPLDTQVKKLTAPASPRGHILKQAAGSSADTIASAAREAQERIVAEKAATQAAKKSVKATEEAAKTAQKRIDVIKGRQKKIGIGAAGVLGLGGVAAKSGTARDVLSGR